MPLFSLLCKEIVAKYSILLVNATFFIFAKLQVMLDFRVNEHKTNSLEGRFAASCIQSELKLYADHQIVADALGMWNSSMSQVQAPRQVRALHKIRNGKLERGNVPRLVAGCVEMSCGYGKQLRRRSPLKPASQR
jgi:hypothetical protein